ncbi:MAG: hypothetical protein E7576_07210 [Ruminococcaceae bacterium]|nr:hypothetical protein [Oscillospiraceae bacterium]
MSVIDIETKKRCVDAYNEGRPPKEIYLQLFHDDYPTASYESFKRRLRSWRKQDYPDRKTLDSGTYEGFTAHNATVQVNSKGEITQAWIKQTLDDGQWDALLDAIRENTEPVRIEPVTGDGIGMLEIPLFDMHLPLSDHTKSIGQLLDIIGRQKWEEINVVIGQDLFHNDDMRGRTASGRVIEKADIPEAWEMARTIWYSVIDASLRQAERVNLIYSIGNHDESLAWCFVQMLKDHYPQVHVDDRFKQRKCIYWNGCFIGLTHGHYARSKVHDLRGQFTIEFPEEFSYAIVREIHAGHLHREGEGDLYGVMIRRLFRNGETDRWSEDEGYVGAHKRFMVFEWMPGCLKAVYYI